MYFVISDEELNEWDSEFNCWRDVRKGSRFYYFKAALAEAAKLSGDITISVVANGETRKIITIHE